MISHTHKDNASARYRQPTKKAPTDRSNGRFDREACMVLLHRILVPMHGMLDMHKNRHDEGIFIPYNNSMSRYIGIFSTVKP